MKKLMWVVPIVFLFELVFGYQGTLIMIQDISIRHILFVGTFFILYGAMFYQLYKERRALVTFKSAKGYLNQFSILDWAVVVFLLSMALSSIVIPLTNGVNLQFTKSEILDTFAYTTLYFPLVFLMKNEYISFPKIESLLYWFIAAQSLLHSILFIGERYAPGFIERYFNILENVLIGESIMPKIVLGHLGSARVIFPTTIFVLIGFMIFFKRRDNLKKIDYAFFLINIFAFLGSMMRSLWFGTLGALVIMIFVLFVFEKRKTLVPWLAKIALISFVFVTALNYTVFANGVYGRMKYTFIDDICERVECDSSGNPLFEDESEKVEWESSNVSNSIKLEQIPYLLKTWEQRPIFGHGYGSVAEGYQRSDVAVFSYEMTFFALLMKIGVFGISIWLGVFLTYLLYVFKQRTPLAFASWTFLLIAFALTVQTNPFLLSFSGFTVVLYLLLSAQFE